MRQKALICKYQLEAVIKKAILIQYEDQPRQGLVLALDFFELRVYVAHATVVAKILRYKIPVVHHRLCFSTGRDTIVLVDAGAANIAEYEAVLEKMIQYDYQIPEQLVDRFFVKLLPGCFRGVSCIAQQKQTILFVKFPPFAQNTLNAFTWTHFSMKRGTNV